MLISLGLNGSTALLRYPLLIGLVLWLQILAAGAEPGLLELKLPEHFDPFVVEAKSQYEAAAQAACHASKPNDFAGYSWRLPKVAAELRQLNGTSVGKQIYIGFLKSKYGYQIDRLNADYGTGAQSFTELLESAMTTVDVTRPKVVEDDREFDADARRDMVDGILEALRRCDPAHADGGIRRLLLRAVLWK